MGTDTDDFRNLNCGQEEEEKETKKATRFFENLWDCSVWKLNIFFLFRKKINTSLYGYENLIENSKNWVNLTKKMKFLLKIRAYCVLEWIFFSQFFEKRHPKVFDMTSAGGNFLNMSVGGQKLGRTSIVWGELKKVINLADIFTDG